MNMERFVVLDSWRGIAACLVALFHLDAYSHLYGVPFLRNSWLFVDFFFVLSGFVIAANYQQRLLDGFGIGRFLLLRLGRLYPLHFTMLALFIGCELLRVLRRILIPALALTNPVALFSTPPEAPDTILANLLLIQSLHLYEFLTWNSYRWRLWMSSRLARIVSGASGGVLNSATGFVKASAGIRILRRTLSSSQPMKSANIVKWSGYSLPSRSKRNRPIPKPSSNRCW